MMPENASIGSRTINPARQEFRCLSQSGTAVDQAAVPAHHARLRGRRASVRASLEPRGGPWFAVPARAGRPCRGAAGQGPILFDLKGFDRPIFACPEPENAPCIAFWTAAGRKSKNPPETLSFSDANGPMRPTNNAV